MKKIDHVFAMRVLERLLSKSESQIRREAAEDEEEWPSGEEELMMALNSQKIMAEAIVNVLGTASDRAVTPDVYRAIFKSAGYPIRDSRLITERDLQLMQRRVDVVFELYEGAANGDEVS